MNRLEILAKIDRLQDGHCKGCQLFDSKGKDKDTRYCFEKCNIGKQLQGLGKQLESIKKERKPLGEKKPVLDIYAYQDYKAKGKTDADIARDYGIKQPTLSYYKKKWFKDAAEPSLKVVEADKKEAPSNTTRRENEAELSSLVGELSTRLDLEKEKVVKLEAKVKELENINAACSDVEEETDNYRQLYEESETHYLNTLEKLIQSDRNLENIKKTAERYELENKAMRELLRLWV